MTLGFFVPYGYFVVVTAL